MSSIIIGLVTFACAFGGVLTGLFIRKFLPEHHLNKESRDAITMGAGLIVTLTALVLGLLISSAKDNFDAMNNSLVQNGAKIIVLDRVLGHYGPETATIREELRNIVTSSIAMIWPRGKSSEAALKRYEATPRMEDIQDKLRELVPQNDSQHSFQSQALGISNELLQSRWLTIEQMQGSLPTVLLAVLLFWLVVLFTSLGMLAPRNATVFAVLFVCALSVSGAVFLIYEMNRPLTGMMKISDAPLLKALEYLGK